MHEAENKKSNMAKRMVGNEVKRPFAERMKNTQNLEDLRHKKTGKRFGR